MICAVDDCASILLAKGYCSKHYQRFRKHGSPETVKYQGKAYHIGVFDSNELEKAITERDRWAMKLYGQNAKLNRKVRAKA